MKKPTTRFLMLILFLLNAIHSMAQVEVIQGAEESELIFLGTTGIIENKNLLNPTTSNIFQRSVTAVEPIVVIEGIDAIQSPNTIVPDANGDVSPEHYVQVTNGQGGAMFQVFHKSGTSLYGPNSLNTFWQSFNISGLGEPIVLWDQEAERWLISERGGSSPKTLLIAVSMTSDPLGNWYAYQLQAPEIPGFPKYGVWSNAYYLTTKENSTGPDSNIPIYVLDRAAMLEGESYVAAQRVGIPKFNTINENTLQVATPADWDGANSPPPDGSPLYVLRMYDDAWGGGQDKLDIWEVDVDWDNGNNTTVSGPIELFTDPFDSDVCDGNIFNCLAQSNGVGISPQMEVLMHRINYRNFGDHEAMVLNHVVDVNGDNQAGVKWYELRKTPGSTWEIFQEGVVSSEDHHRFIGSIAIDAAGNIGLGYSIMSDSKDLSLAFTGRKKDDPLNEMTVDEYEFATGLSAFGGFRWGDYAMMSVDESDGRTFWATGEYMKENAQWGTKIAAFQVSRDSFDIGPYKILKPIDSPYLTSYETAEIQIKNFGLAAQSNFIVGVIIDGVFLTESTVSDTIQPDSVLDISIEGPIDMAQLGNYDFKIYTYLPGDENTYNDTLRKSVNRLIRLDAAITGFTEIEALVCDTFTDIGIILTNLGPDTLFTSKVEWQYNAGVQSAINWNGVLATDESDTIYVLVNALLDGLNEINAGCSTPNGMLDENTENDVLDRGFLVEIAGEKIALHLRTDLHPTETSWTLTDEFGMLLYEGESYEAPYTEYIETLCLVEGCYTFTIYDSWIDGLTAGSPDGGYYLEDESGNILATIKDTAFLTSEENSFCLPFVCTLSSEALASVETEVGADDGAINITADHGIPPYQYSIDNGMSFQDSPEFTGLSGNIYNVVVMDVNGCTFEMEVEVATCTLQFTVVVTNATTGLEDGSIEIDTDSSGVPPYRYSIDNGNEFYSSNLFTDLPSGFYYLVVEDSLGCIATFEVPVNVMVGTDERGISHQIEVLPNPTEGLFRVNVLGLSSVNDIEIELLDARASVILNHRLEKYGETLTGELSIGQLPAGVYFIRFKHEAIQGLVKVVKK